MNQRTDGGSDNTDLLIREALRNGEDYLRSQLDMAVAGDQRAIGLGGILIAAASVVIGFAMTGDSNSLNIKAACLFMAIGLAVAGGLAFYAARPVKLYCVGNIPSKWKKDIEADRPFHEALADELNLIEDAVRENSVVIDRNSAALNRSMILCAAVVLVAGLYVAIPMIF